MVWPLLIGAGLSALGSYLGGKSEEDAADKQASAAAATQQSSIWGPQQDYLKDVYGQGWQTYHQNQAAIPGQQAYFQGLQQQGQQAFNNLAMGPQNPYLTGMANAAFGDIGRQFQQQIMPGLVGGANAAGGMGGERFAQMQAQAAAEAQRAMGDVGNKIYGAAWQSGMQGQQAALGALPALGNLGMQSMQVPYANLAGYQAAVGNPVLGHGADFGANGVAAAPVNPYASMMQQFGAGSPYGQYGESFGDQNSSYGMGYDTAGFGVDHGGPGSQQGYGGYGGFGGLGDALGGALGDAFGGFGGGGGFW